MQSTLISACFAFLALSHEALSMNSKYTEIIKDGEFHASTTSANRPPSTRRGAPPKLVTTEKDRAGLPPRSPRKPKSETKESEASEK
ncbi:hypothetical protein PCASD_10984 [Puccinia coronata f. sp. avenae]|uniref:Secreted protein n=1 Tax=Puccinia coronata f. sp. avenae TaxID=200324 RepID=A0A2N5TEQ9_9BASI|nr:hypothetical protein PCASD_10984 [Puccinia coronata f. sp. avenae]